MASQPDRSLAPHHPEGTALARRQEPSTSIGLFCASPTVLEAINYVLRQRGLPLLWTHADGTIGVADPLLLRVEYIPTPFLH